MPSRGRISGEERRVHGVVVLSHNINVGQVTHIGVGAHSDSIATVHNELSSSKILLDVRRNLGSPCCWNTHELIPGLPAQHRGILSQRQPRRWILHGQECRDVRLERRYHRRIQVEGASSCCRGVGSRGLQARRSIGARNVVPLHKRILSPRVVIPVVHQRDDQSKSKLGSFADSRGKVACGLGRERPQRRLEALCVADRHPKAVGTHHVSPQGSGSAQPIANPEQRRILHPAPICWHVLVEAKPVEVGTSKAERITLELEAAVRIQCNKGRKGS
mmetsp:Transcript_32721/g.98831  ORF Transcript_32721/g.98831 Transcript_32721/m.98831 type:complete len:275 (-) Transcript_32721:134-958(-)